MNTIFDIVSLLPYVMAFHHMKSLPSFEKGPWPWLTSLVNDLTKDHSKQHVEQQQGANDFAACALDLAKLFELERLVIHGVESGLSLENELVQLIQPDAVGPISSSDGDDELFFGLEDEDQLVADSSVSTLLIFNLDNVFSKVDHVAEGARIFNLLSIDQRVYHSDCVLLP